MKIKRKQIIAFILGVVALAVVSASFAYYSSGWSLDNRLITKNSEVLLSEVFNPKDKWLPGETKQKEVSFGNKGEYDQVIRFKVTETWYENNGTANTLTDDTALADGWWTGSYSENPAVINWTSDITGPNAKWVKIGDWYYMKSILPKQSGNVPTMTGNVIESVSFSDELSNASPGAADDFTNKRYSLLVQMETLGVNSAMTEAEWSVRFTAGSGGLEWSTLTP